MFAKKILDLESKELKERKVTMKTSELFKKEIDYIVNPILQKIVSDTLDASPECIQTIPASSSGRYHSKNDIVVGYVDEDDTVHSGGLVNHVRAVTAIAYSLMGSNAFKDIALGIGEVDSETLAIYQDCAIAACILHDCMKPDDTPKHSTKFDHPLLAAKLFKETARKYITQENMDYMKVVIPLIHGCIASHMNKWNTAPYAKGIVLPTPKLGIEVFVSLCDYIGSRKFIDFNFEVYDGK